MANLKIRMTNEIRLTFLLTSLAALGIARGEDDRREADKRALSALQWCVGQWRGVGQPRRGSTRDAWIEQADWAWKFSGQRAAIAFNAPQGRFYRSGELRPDQKQGQFRFIGTLPDGKTQEELTGTLDKDGTLLLVAKMPQPGRPAQISIRPAGGGDRLVIGMQQSSPASSGVLAMLAEIGYTRQGSNFGKGSTGPECVVTGGLGTIKVAYAGKEYYVCCTGCRDLFNDNPEAALAEHRARKEAQRQEQK
jgi:hypothetical protein